MVPAKTAAAPANAVTKPAAAGATDAASKDPAKPATTAVATTDNKAAGDKDKPAVGDAAAGEGDSQNFAEMRDKFKPAKKTVAVPAELLSDAKSYDDKLILVKILTEKEQNRVVLMIKNMLRSTGAEKKK